MSYVSLNVFLPLFLALSFSLDKLPFIQLRFIATDIDTSHLLDYKLCQSLCPPCMSVSLPVCGSLCVYVCLSISLSLSLSLSLSPSLALLSLYVFHTLYFLSLFLSLCQD